ncbi:MAG: DUF3592 domain-containing protein [Gammaproteobacteria bacterium]|nr:DUF3592 domain-containing protein [Gammaproteobacteria bacterium]
MQNKGASFSGILFGSAFFMAGVATFYFIVLTTLLDAWQMQPWQSVRADLVSADITSYKKKTDNGGYSIMYQIKIQYEYQVGGQTYRGDRLNINNTSSSDRSKHYPLLKKIKGEYHDQNFSVWVNPNNANESVYDRTLNWKILVSASLFSGIFIVFGGGIISFSLGSKGEDNPLHDVDPAKPWTTRAEWASPVIYSQAKGDVKFRKFCAIFAVMVFGTFSFGMMGEGTVFTIIAVLMWIPPVLTILWYLRAQKEWDRFQRVSLTLSTYPGVIGGLVKGHLVIPTTLSVADQYTLKLKCTQHITREIGNSRKYSSSVVWSDEQTPKPKADANGTYITFEFKVPADKHQSSIPGSNYHHWTLEVKSELSGINFNRDYEIPVFVTDESKTIEDELKEQPLTLKEKEAIKDRLSVNDTVGESISMQIPGSKSGLVLAGIGSIFCIVGILVATVGEDFFGVIFAGLSCLFIGAGVWFWGRNCKVNITPNRCEIDVLWFSNHIKTYLLFANDIKKIEPYRSSSTSVNGVQSSERFGLRVHSHLGKVVDIGGEFASMKNATHMKLEIENMLNTQSSNYNI